MFSDGRARDPDRADAIARAYGRMKVPIHVFPAGESGGGGDVAIVALVAAQPGPQVLQGRRAGLRAVLRLQGPSRRAEDRGRAARRPGGIRAGADAGRPGGWAEELFGVVRVGRSGPSDRGPDRSPARRSLDVEQRLRRRHGDRPHEDPRALPRRVVRAIHPAGGPVRLRPRRGPRGLFTAPGRADGGPGHRLHGRGGLRVVGRFHLPRAHGQRRPGNPRDRLGALRLRRHHPEQRPRRGARRQVPGLDRGVGRPARRRAADGRRSLQLRVRPVERDADRRDAPRRARPGPRRLVRDGEERSIPSSPGPSTRSGRSPPTRCRTARCWGRCLGSSAATASAASSRRPTSWPATIHRGPAASPSPRSPSSRTGGAGRWSWRRPSPADGPASSPSRGAAPTPATTRSSGATSCTGCPRTPRPAAAACWPRPTSGSTARASRSSSAPGVRRGRVADARLPRGRHRRAEVVDRVRPGQLAAPPTLGRGRGGPRGGAGPVPPLERGVRAGTRDVGEVVCRDPADLRHEVAPRRRDPDPGPAVRADRLREQHAGQQLVARGAGPRRPDRAAEPAARPRPACAGWPSSPAARSWPGRRISRR